MPGRLTGYAATCWTVSGMNEGRGHGVRVQIELESEMYQGILGIEFSALCRGTRDLVRAENIEDQSKCRKKNNQDFWCKAGCPSGSLCVLLFLCWKRGWPACLDGPCLLQNWFWGGVAESWEPEALQNCQMCHTTFSGFSSGGE